MYEERQGKRDKKIHVPFMKKLKIKIDEEAHE